MSREAVRQPRRVIGPSVGDRVRACLAALVICSCAAMWVGASAGDASGVIACGTTKVIDGHALRVQILRGNVSCRSAREVIRYHVVDRYTPGDLPSGPNAWGCDVSRRSWIVTCTQGPTRTVRGLPR